MKTFETEARKPKIWLDYGLMISLEENGEISAVLYKRGFFSTWKVINESTEARFVNYAIVMINRSMGKSIRTIGKVSNQHGGYYYRNLALELLDENF